jgi:hypothetical protein
VLAGLAFRFDDPSVHVDQTTYNPARIWKLYGTVACKGDDVADRPHRVARLLDVPEHLEVVASARLQAVAGWLPIEPHEPVPLRGHSRGRHATKAGDGFDLDTWIGEHAVAVDGPRAWGNGRKWIFPICPWNPEHTNGSAFLVQFPSGGVAAGCHHDGCRDENWQTLRDRVEPNRQRSPHHTHMGAIDDERGRRDQAETQVLTATRWPDPPHDLAYHGLAGRIVQTLTPGTEADPVALLVSLLAAVGNLVGSGPHWSVSGSDHGPRVWPILVGDTSRGRKGTAWSAVKTVLRLAARDWLETQVVSGLSSGEGVIWAVRDPIVTSEAIREGNQRHGRVIDYQEVITDEGVDDKRLFVIEEEFASTLKVMMRDADILSAVLRQAWDQGNLRTLTKTSPAVATGAHITVLGHITKHELLRYLDSTEAGNGFANRFLWVCVRRAQLLPDGGEFDTDAIQKLGQLLRIVLERSQRIGSIRRDNAANRLWRTVYAALAEERVGLLGAVTSRAEAQVMRLASIYAVLDSSMLIQPVHLQAAVALWDYLEASVGTIFGEALGDPVADMILRELRQRGELTRTDIRDLFAHNLSASRINHALELLQLSGMATRSMRESGGRPVEVWTVDNRPATGAERDGRRRGGVLDLIVSERVGSVRRPAADIDTDQTAGTPMAGSKSGDAPIGDGAANRVCQSCQDRIAA